MLIQIHSSPTQKMKIIENVESQSFRQDGTAVNFEAECQLLHKAINDNHVNNQYLVSGLRESNQVPSECEAGRRAAHCTVVFSET
jgi:hypothetical protein